MIGLNNLAAYILNILSFIQWYKTFSFIKKDSIIRIKE